MSPVRFRLNDGTLLSMKNTGYREKERATLPQGKLLTWFHPLIPLLDSFHDYKRTSPFKAGFFLKQHDLISLPVITANERFQVFYDENGCCLPMGVPLCQRTGFQTCAAVKHM